MKVPFLDLSRQHNSIKEELEDAFARVRSREWYILGPEVEAFEAEFAAYIGTEFAVGVANGTEALQIALMALGVKQGDDVITTANTAVPTATSIRMAGANPVFSEIDGDNWNLDPARLEDSIARKTSAVIPVHLYGNPAQTSEICKIASERGIAVVEDCCQAHGAELEGRKVGTFGQASAFSFYPTKNLGALGDGGMITTNDEAIYKRCILLRNYGQTERNRHTAWGINSRLDDLQAAFLRVKLKHLDEWNDMRIKAAGLYKNLLKKSPLKFQSCNGKNVYHILAVQLPENIKREKFTDFLKSRGIATAVHYPMPIYHQESFRQYAPKKTPPITEKHCYSVVSLPIFPFISEEEIEYTSQTIISFF